MRLRQLIFFVLSLIPIFLLLITMVQYTDVTMNDVLNAILPVFPDSVSWLIRSIVIQVYSISDGFIPLTVIVALWSAGKGVLSVTSGLNCIYSNTETRNYFYLRIRAIRISIPSGDYALADHLCLREQYQRDGI